MAINISQTLTINQFKIHYLYISVDVIFTNKNIYTYKIVTYTILMK